MIEENDEDLNTVGPVVKLEHHVLQGKTSAMMNTTGTV